MPKSMTADVANLIVQALQRGLSRSQIAGVVGVSRRAITRISTNLRLHGQPKAPPSGLKQGRPIKMTEAQANAMLGWMAGRDYTFYIKDLTTFLKERHDFAGCDGTVRRALIRAGFKRKLPWRKSEITGWIPPDGPPDLSFVMHPKPPPKSKRSQADAAAPRSSTSLAPASAVAATTNDNVVGEDCPNRSSKEEYMLQLQAHAKALARTQPAGEQHPGIDPALEEATLPNVDPCNNGQETHYLPPVTFVSTNPVITAPNSAVSSVPPPTHTDTQQPFSGQSSSTANDPTRKRKRAPTTTTARAAKVIVLQQPQRQPANPIDPDLVTTLQSEVARQQEVIQQLQRQLAQGVSAPAIASTVPATTAATPAAASTSTVTHVPDDAQSSQQKQEQTDDEADDDEQDDDSEMLRQPTMAQLKRLQALIDATSPVSARSGKAKLPGGPTRDAARDHDDSLANQDENNQEEYDDDDAI